VIALDAGARELELSTVTGFSCLHEKAGEHLKRWTATATRSRENNSLFFVQVLRSHYWYIRT
jgi:hypothetical protein